MSILLPIVDMSKYAVGQGGVVTLDAAKQTQPSSAAHATDDAHIRVFNDSGSTLSVWVDTGNLQEYLPAGGWLTWSIDQTANEFHWNVLNILPNPPIQMLMVTYYRQGEQVPEIPQLGNSPIGGGLSTTSNVTNSLSNEGNPAPTLVIDIGDTNFPQLITIYNDGSAIWAVDQAGVKHQAWRVNNAGTQFQIGQAGDTAEVLGQFKIDQLLTAAGITDVGSISQTGGTVIITGNAQGSVHVGQVAQGDVIDTSGTIVFYKAPGTIQFQIPSGTNVASIVGTTFACPTINATTRLNLAQSGWDHLSQFSGTGSGTFGTGLSVVPSGIYCNPCTLSGSSQTIGFTTATSSVVTTGNGLAWFGQAIH